jgi:uncharacterized protein
MDHREEAIDAGGLTRRRQLFELLAFVFAILPGVVLFFVVLRPRELTFTSIAVHSILVNLVLLSVVLLLVRRNGEPVQALGWRRPEGRWRELALGAALFVPFTLFAALVEAGVRAAGLTGPEAPPQFLIPVGAAELLLALVFLAVVAVCEETVFRGYLILRLHAVTGNVGTAVVVSALIFSLGHGYQGTAGLATVAVMGMVLALIYLWRESLIAPMVIHFLQNFMGIVVAPVLPQAA